MGTITRAVVSSASGGKKFQSSRNNPVPPTVRFVQNAAGGTVSHAATHNISSLVGNFPAGIQAGDEVWLVLTYQTNGTDGFFANSIAGVGWTLVGTMSDTGLTPYQRTYLLRRTALATGTESGTPVGLDNLTAGASGTTGVAATWLVFAPTPGVALLQPTNFTNSTSQFAFANGTTSSATVATTSSAATGIGVGWQLAVLAGHNNNQNAVPTNGYLRRSDENTANALAAQHTVTHHVTNPTLYGMTTFHVLSLTQVSLGANFTQFQYGYTQPTVPTIQQGRWGVAAIGRVVGPVAVPSAVAKGAWQEVFASTEHDSTHLVVEMVPTTLANGTGMVTTMMDLAVGAAGAEQVVVPNLTSASPGYLNASPVRAALFDVPLRVPAGTRLSMRLWQATDFALPPYAVNAVLVG